MYLSPEQTKQMQWPECSGVIAKLLSACNAKPLKEDFHRSDPDSPKFTVWPPPLPGTHTQTPEWKLRISSWRGTDIVSDLPPTKSEGLSGAWIHWEKFISLLQNSGLELKPMSLSLGILLSTCVSTFYHFITAFSLLQTSTLGNYLFPLYALASEWRILKLSVSKTVDVSNKRTWIGTCARLCVCLCVWVFVYMLMSVWEWLPTLTLPHLARSGSGSPQCSQCGRGPDTKTNEVKEDNCGLMLSDQMRSNE